MYSDRKTEELIHIWKTCFDDEESSIAFFFRYFGLEVQTLTLEKDGKSVSMVNLLPAEVRLQGGFRQAYYIYAVGTLPEYRNRGYAGALLREAADQAEKEDKFLFLVPEKKELWRFYEKLGFSAWACPGLVLREETAWRPGTEAGLDGFGLEELGMEPYLALRDRAFAREGYLRLSRKGAAYALKLWEEEGGRCALLRVGEKEYGILYRMSGQCAVFREVTASRPEEAAAVAAKAARLAGAETFSLRQGRTVFGRGKGISWMQRGYFNQAMD